MTKIRIYGQIIIEFLPRAKKVVGRDFALDAIESGNVFNPPPTVAGATPAGELSLYTPQWYQTSLCN